MKTKYEFDDDVASICESTVSKAKQSYLFCFICWFILSLLLCLCAAGCADRGLPSVRAHAQNRRLAAGRDREHQGAGWQASVLRALCGL